MSQKINLRDPEPVGDMLRLAELVGQTIAVRVVKSSATETRYGETTRYDLDYATLSMARPMRAYAYGAAFRSLSEGEWYAVTVRERDTQGYQFEPAKAAEKKKLLGIISSEGVSDADIPF